MLRKPLRRSSSSAIWRGAASASTSARSASSSRRSAPAFPAERLTLHGAGKSDEELRAAARGRAGRIVVDGIEELERLARLVATMPDRRTFSCGSTSASRRTTHAFVRTGGDDTKFGIHPRDEPLARVTAARVAACASPDCTRTSARRSTNRQPYAACAHELVAAGSASPPPACRRVASSSAADSACRRGRVNEPNRSTSARRCAPRPNASRKSARRNGIPAPRLGIEPGRAVIGPAGTTLYRVLAVKRQTVRTFVVVDGGVAENPRPALYGAHHHVVPAAAPMRRRGRGDALRPVVRERRARDRALPRMPARRRPAGDVRDGRLHVQHGGKLQSLSASGRRRRLRRLGSPAGAAREHRRRPGA